VRNHECNSGFAKERMNIWGRAFTKKQQAAPSLGPTKRKTALGQFFVYLIEPYEFYFISTLSPFGSTNADVN